MSSFDVQLFQCLYQWGQRLPWLGLTMTWVTRVSSLVFALIYLCALASLFSSRSSRLAAGLVGPALSMLTVQLARILFYRPRPFVTFDLESLVLQSDSSSLPSQHATSAFAIATMVWFLHPRLGQLVFAAAGLTALSRVITGVHYPGDVILGACFGVFWSSLAFLIDRHRQGLEQSSEENRPSTS